MKKRNIFIAVILCALCFSIGLIIPKNDRLPRTGDIMEVNGVKVFVNDNNQNTQKYIENLKKMPSWLCVNVGEIIITDEDINETLNLGMETNVLAVTIRDRIYINNSTYSDNVIIHELFHVYDVAHDMFTAKYGTIADLYEKEGHAVGVSPGNKKNIQEYFATAGEKYFMSNEMLKETSPETYEYFRELVSAENDKITK